MQEDQLQEGRGNSLFTVKNLIILLLGIILGYFIKIQASQKITMGYDDYKLPQWQSNIKNIDIDVNEKKQAVEDGGNTDLGVEANKNNK